MDRAEAIEILENGDWWFALDVQYTIENPEDEKLHDASDMAIAALREQEQRKWISVKERLPEESGPVLAYETSLGVIAAYYHADMISSAWQSITHWMPLPEPPKEGAE